MSKKILGAGVVLMLVAAVLVGVGASAVSAQSVSCANIDSMLTVFGITDAAKIAQAKVAFGCSGTVSASYTFTRDLTVGSTGADVTALQTKLGVTPATGYFGSITKAAVVAYQTANGIVPAAGYVGPLTRATLNYVSPVVVVPGTPTPGTPSTGDLEGNAGSIDVSASSEFKDEEIAEGEESIEVMTFSVEADDESDVEVTSIRIALVNNDTASSSADLDDYAESVSVLFKGKVVGEADVDDFSENSDVWTKSISLDGVVVRAGDEEDITIAVTALNVIDSEDTESDAWNIDVTSVRFLDAEGVTTTETVTATVDKDFDFVVEGEDEDLEIKSSSSDPDASTLLVEEDDESDFYEVFAFKIEAVDGDIDLNELVLTVTTGSEDYDTVVSDAMISIDGENFDVDTVDDEDTTTADLTFDIDGDFTIDADDTVEVVVSLQFRAQDGAYVSGSETVQVKTVSVEGEGADDVSDTATVNGEEHTLSLSVPVVSGVTTSARTTDDDAAGTISFEFTIDAEDDDVVLAVANNAAVNGTTDEVMFTVTGTDTGIAVAGLTLIDGDAVYASGAWTIAEGDDATFALDVTLTTVNSGDNGTYRVRLNTVDGITVDKLSSSISLVY